MRVMMALLVATLLLPGTQAQGHDHGDAGPIVIATDLNSDGLALVGHPAHFNIIAFGDDDEPDFHQDLPVRVYNNDRVVFETGNVAGHDYDGIQAFDIAFMEAGTWRVEALQGGDIVAHRNGTVQEATGNATIVTTPLATEMLAAMGFIDATFAIVQNGSLVPHVDALVEVFDDDERLVFRTHTHSHEEEMAFSFRPSEPGTYALRITGFISFPTESGPRFAPVVHEQTVEVGSFVGAGMVRVPGVPPAGMNAVVRGENGPLQLIGTFDPWTQVGPDTIQRLSATVVGEDGRPVQHVDFSAELRGPEGLVFASDSLHEYDGTFELALQQATLGIYDLTIRADHGTWMDEITMSYAVAPAGTGTKQGDQLFSVEAAGQQGNLTTIRIEGKDTDGAAYAHGEIDVDIRTPDDLPLLLTKIHTHGDGVFSFDYAPPVAGDLGLGLTPFPLEAGLLLAHHGDAVGQDIQSTMGVEAAPHATDILDATPSDRSTPAAPLALLAVALLVAARRR